MLKHVRWVKYWPLTNFWNYAKKLKSRMINLCMHSNQIPMTTSTSSWSRRPWSTKLLISLLLHTESLSNKTDWSRSSSMPMNLFSRKRHSERSNRFISSRSSSSWRLQEYSNSTVWRGGDWMRRNRSRKIYFCPTSSCGKHSTNTKDYATNYGSANWSKLAMIPSWN